MTSRNTYHTHTHSFAAGFITASVFFMIPVLLVPNIRAEFIYSGTMDYSTQDIDMDGIDDAYDTSFNSGMSDAQDNDDDDGGYSSSSMMPDMDDDDNDDGGYSSSSVMPHIDDDDDMGDTGGDMGGDTGGDYEYNYSSSAAMEAGLDCDGDGYMDDPCSYACWDDMDGDGVMDDPCSE